MNEVEDIFRTRETSVTSKDDAAFKATQTRFILGCGADRYLKCDKVSSEVLSAHQDEIDSKLVAALVREEYWKKRKALSSLLPSLLSGEAER